MAPEKNGGSCSLGFEVISSQFGVVNLEQDVGIADGGGSDLWRRTMGVGQKAAVLIKQLAVLLDWF